MDATATMKTEPVRSGIAGTIYRSNQTATAIGCSAEIGKKTEPCCFGISARSAELTQKKLLSSLQMLQNLLTC